MKKPRNKIQNAEIKNEAMFTTWGKDDSAPSPKVFNSNQLIQRASASNVFRNIDTNISVRDGMTRDDYNAFRPDEASPYLIKNIIRTSMWSYKKIGLVHNVIDLMADFACQGIEIVHPNKSSQKFFETWAKKVRFKERSERFLNLLYRTANVIVRRSHVKLTQSYVDNLHRVVGSADIDVNILPKTKKNEIPFSYYFYNPLAVEVINFTEDLGIFTGKIQYGIRIPPHIIAQINSPRNSLQVDLVNSIPDYIVAAVREGVQVIPFDPQKVSIYHYKKDDWEVFAEPLVSCILDDLTALNKLKLADLAALDGAISHIRLWRLGSLEHKIYPTEAAVSRLADMLASSVGGGPIDIIWGPELDIKETGTEIHKFLGSEKYASTLISIYDGLGIPLALTGYAAKGGLTNNFLSLKTLIERLQYGREMLETFWQPELDEVQRGLGFRQPAQLRYSRMTLADEAAEKALLIQMSDRNLISTETIQERFGEIPELELMRQNREEKQRAAGRRPRKASQWQNPEYKEKLATIALQTGIVAPSQVGLDLFPAKTGTGEVPAMDAKLKSQEAMKKAGGQPMQGRPISSKDKNKRKAKAVGIQKKPSQKIATALMWARSAQEDISKIVNKWYCEANEKQNIRQLSDEKSEQLDNLKYALLCNSKLYSKIEEASLANLISSEKTLSVAAPINELFQQSISQFTRKFNKEPSLDEVRQMQAAVYALYIGDI